MDSFINEAKWDRALRVVAGAAVMLVGWVGVVSGVLGLLMMIVGIAMMLSGIIGFCPAYNRFKFSTLRRAGPA